MTTLGDKKKLTPHNPNVICDICGRKRKWSEVIEAYGTGDIPVVISCKDGCADYRHPLNSPPPVIFDGQPVPNARPDVSTANATYDNGVNSIYRIGSLRLGMIGYINNPNNNFNMNGLFLVGQFPGNNQSYINNEFP